jgi:hypothetical protein
LVCFFVLGFVSFWFGLWAVGFCATTYVGAMLVGCGGSELHVERLTRPNNNSQKTNTKRSEKKHFLIYFI